MLLGNLATALLAQPPYLLAASAAAVLLATVYLLIARRNRPAASPCCPAGSLPACPADGFPAYDALGRELQTATPLCWYTKRLAYYEVTFADTAKADAAKADGDSATCTERSTSTPSDVVATPSVAQAWGIPKTSTLPLPVVVIFTDVFGWQSGRHRAVCDDLARRGRGRWKVVMPDLFRGDPPAVLPDGWCGVFRRLPRMAREVLQAPRMLWHLRRTWTEARVVDAEVFSRLLPHLRECAEAERGGQGEGTDAGGFPGLYGYDDSLRLACMGFCFGGWVVAKSCCREEEGVAGGGGFACGVGAHPSWNVELLHGGGERAIAERVRCPMLLMPASNDSGAVKPGGAVVRALGERHRQGALRAGGAGAGGAGAGADGCMFRDMEANVVRSVEFRDRKHGWVTRGDEACPAVAADQSRALDLACEWFGLHLAP